MQARYHQLVREHCRAADPLAPGLNPAPSSASAFASAQAAWRFYANTDTDLPTLVGPLHQAARSWRAAAAATTVGLVVHDWSSLKYPGHASKADQATLSRPEDRGYELATALLVDGASGDPVAPLEMRLLTADAVHSTRDVATATDAFRIDEVLATMRDAARLGLGALVHVIDREADSLDHYRQWQADGHRFLVRADGERLVRYEGREITVQALAEELRRRGQFRRSRDVTYRGRSAVQRVAEVTVVLDRPAYRNRRRGGKVVKQRLPGPPLTLRLIVSRVCDGAGRTLAVWYLLTNVGEELTAETVALWYYWRWRIESFFKLLKGAGQQLEHWQQRSGAAIAKRLLVAAMACAVVWLLERDSSAGAAELRLLLVRLSGRQLKRGRESTAPALLAGLWVYLALVDVLQEHGVEELLALKKYLSFVRDESG